ncbi:unnamed protein product [Staurois parvus]|uniref:Uncharacterized protein n=1 Tax=Staurois parvus TaxID=386267 RepID=A0ABN9CKI4_9NEOB|nr:unnamed protein product [Staurois parvus]
MNAVSTDLSIERWNHVFAVTYHRPSSKEGCHSYSHSELL